MLVPAPVPSQLIHDRNPVTVKITSNELIVVPQKRRTTKGKTNFTRVRCVCVHACVCTCMRVRVCVCVCLFVSVFSCVCLRVSNVPVHLLMSDA